jgi:hypothetical protein
MTLQELKQLIAELPTEYDDRTVVIEEPSSNNSVELIQPLMEVFLAIPEKSETTILLKLIEKF